MRAGRPMSKRIDYPRRERSGWRRWVPSWKLVLGTGLVSVVVLVGAFAAAVALTPIPQPTEIARAQTTAPPNSGDSAPSTGSMFP